MEASVTTVTTFTIFNIPVHNVEFIVGGGEPGQGARGASRTEHPAGFADVEYDLAHGIIRFFKPDGCKHVNLAYWLKRGDSYHAWTSVGIAHLAAHDRHRVSEWREDPRCVR